MWVSQVCISTKDIPFNKPEKPGVAADEDVQGNVEDKTYATKAGNMTCVPLLLHIAEFERRTSKENNRFYVMTMNTLEFLFSLIEKKRISNHPIIVRLFGADSKKYELPSQWKRYNNVPHVRTQILEALRLN